MYVNIDRKVRSALMNMGYGGGATRSRDEISSNSKTACSATTRESREAGFSAMRKLTRAYRPLVIQGISSRSRNMISGPLE